MAKSNFYPRPPRGGRPRDHPQLPPYHQISIHALREEGDLLSSIRTTCMRWNFYPRPPRGGRPRPYGSHSSGSRFLSTPSARRATRTGIAARTSRTDFYPRPPRGGRRCGMGLLSLVFGFLSTPSARRATIAVDRSFARQGISIHALREEGDPALTAPTVAGVDFYPRPPRGGRPQSMFPGRSVGRFLSTPSARRATCPLPTTTRSARFLSTPSARRATKSSYWRR